MEGLRRFVLFLKERMYNPRVLFALSGLMFLALAFTSTKILRGGGDPFRSRSDFDDYYEAARRLQGGRDLYLMNQMDRILQLGPDLTTMRPEQLLRLLQESRGVGAYLYPPFFAWALGPLAWLDYPRAALIYQLLSLVILALSLFYLYRRTDHLWQEGKGAPGPVNRSLTVLVGATVVYFGFLNENASNGNAGFLIFGLSAFGILFSFQDARGAGGWKGFIGGFLIGLAAAIKIIPGFLSGVLFAGRRWSSLAGFVGGLVFAFIVPALTLGWQADLDRHQDWYNLLIHNYGTFSVVRPYANNQTVSAALSKLFVAGSDMRQSAFGLPFAIGPEKTVFPMIAMIIRSVNLLFVGALGILLLMVAWKRPIAGLSDVNLSRILSLTLLTALVTSGVSWYHTYAILILPLSLRLVLPQRLSRTEKLAFGGPAVLSLILSIVPSVLNQAASLYSVYVWMALSAAVLHQMQAWKEFNNTVDGPG